MKHIAKIQSEFLKLSELQDDVKKSEKKNNLTVFLGGTVSDDWRDEFKKKYGTKLSLLDPYDDDWSPEENIYDEIAAMQNADYVVFYKGGEFTEREQKLLDSIDRDYNEFTDLKKMHTYFDTLVNLQEVEKQIEKF